MIIRYRDHLVLVTEIYTVDAEIAEIASKAKLPTKATATESEGLDICLGRAFDLIDLYVDAQEKTDQIPEPQRQAG